MVIERVLIDFRIDEYSFLMLCEQRLRRGRGWRYGEDMVSAIPIALGMELSLFHCPYRERVTLSTPFSHDGSGL